MKVCSTEVHMYLMCPVSCYEYLTGLDCQLLAKQILTVAKLMPLNISHNTNRIYFSLYFIIPNQTKAAD